MDLLDFKFLTYKGANIPKEWYFSVSFKFKNDNYEYLSYILYETVSIVQFPIYLEYNDEFLISIMVWSYLFTF